MEVLEEWFRWGEEWSQLLRFYAGVGRASAVLEIGCGLGRIAFPLRYVLLDGSYDGFDIVREKVEFLEREFHSRHPRFCFKWADVRNTCYNPRGRIAAEEYRFPYPDASFDVVFAASVFTHLLPEAAANYLRQSARVLRPGGRCLVSFFFLDHYRPGQPRPLGFASEAFAFDHRYGDYGDDFAVSDPGNPECVMAYRFQFVERLATLAGLEVVQQGTGLWSGTVAAWTSALDFVMLRRPVAQVRLSGRLRAGLITVGRRAGSRRRRRRRGRRPA